MRLGDLIEHIVKVKGGYRLVSKKSGRNLGTYPTRAGAEKRERQVQYFKHAGESVEHGVVESNDHIGDTIRELYQQIYDQGDDALEYLNTSAPLFAQFWDQYEGDLDSIIAEVSPKNLIRIAKELKAVTGQEGVSEEWSQKYKNSINCSHPKGFSQKAHCAGRNKNEGVAEGIETIYGRPYEVDPNKYYVWAWDSAVVIYGEYDNIKDAKINLPKIEQRAIERLGPYVKDRFELSTGKELLQRYGKKESNEGVAEDSEDSGEKFDIHGLDPVTKKLLISIRSKYPWAKTDLEALLTYIKDEDTTLEKDIDGLEHKDSEHDHEIDDLDTEVDQEQTTIKQVKSAEDLQNAKIADIEKKVNAISSRIFGRD